MGDHGAPWADQLNLDEIKKAEAMNMKYDEIEIEFQDEGQDVLKLTVRGDTGEITDCGLFHTALYASGKCFVVVDDLTTYSHVSYMKDGMLCKFKWPMKRLVADGKVLCDASGDFSI